MAMVSRLISCLLAVSIRNTATAVSPNFNMYVKIYLPFTYEIAKPLLNVPSTELSIYLAIDMLADVKALRCNVTRFVFCYSL